MSTFDFECSSPIDVNGVLTFVQIFGAFAGSGANRTEPGSVRLIPTPRQELPFISTANPGSRPVTRSQSEPPATHEDSEEEMEIGWLWSYNMPEADANCSLHTRERNRGVLRPQAREFVPQNGHSVDANDDPPSVQETEAEDYLSFSKAEVQDVEMPEVELGWYPHPKDRVKREIHPPNRLTYDVLGTCSEGTCFTAKRNSKMLSPSNVDLEKDNPTSVLDTSVQDTTVSAVSAQNSLPSHDNWWEAPLSVLCHRLEAKMCNRAKILTIFGDQRFKAGGACSSGIFAI
ncbi:hypothetical protein AB205_0171720 [Aquarana catesbeiana]|uniref:Uncharacterized protein n=1 Tax=Aquarana catesbeiana TaxID=8400 RepID=A0A2G9R5S3_AQUCT|nr:hypothetical protein AB205_0171720 [Aquarana catesbeiana]